MKTCRNRKILAEEQQAQRPRGRNMLEGGMLRSNKSGNLDETKEGAGAEGVFREVGWGRGNPVGNYRNSGFYSEGERKAFRF